MCRKFMYLISFVLLLCLTLTSTASAELVGWWKLDEGTGTAFLDSTSYFNDGTINPWNATKVVWTANGYKNSALDFISATGPFAYCDAPIKTGLLDMQNATASFWMNIPKTFQAWGIIFDLLMPTARTA